MIRSRTASRGGGVSASLPMTSMIDVVFLLLIFFMLTANFAADEDRLRSALDAQRRSAAGEDLRPQVVDIAADPAGGAVFSIGANAVKSGVALRNILRGLPKEQGVVIRVADNAPIDAAAAALQAAADAGFDRRTYVPGGGGGP